MVGTKGKIHTDTGRILNHAGKPLYQFDFKQENNPYQTEHDQLFAAVAKGEYKFADAENGAYSSMTAIMGRLATYSGQLIEWDKAFNSGLNLHPATYGWDTMPPVQPNEEGIYTGAIPGQTIFL
mgnify:FL=1